LLESLQHEPQTYDLLADVIVQIPGNTLAFVFLHADKAAEQASDLFFAATAILYFRIQDAIGCGELLGAVFNAKLQRGVRLLQRIFPLLSVGQIARHFDVAE
jgi:hypothetical protein